MFVSGLEHFPGRASVVERERLEKKAQKGNNQSAYVLTILPSVEMLLCIFFLESVNKKSCEE